MLIYLFIRDLVYSTMVITFTADIQLDKHVVSYTLLFQQKANLVNLPFSSDR